MKKKAKGIATAEELNIQVVPESIIDECKNGTDAISCINRINMVPWGSDVSICYVFEARMRVHACTV